MRDIQVSIDVFARIWALREEGEDSEDSILRRVLWQSELVAGPALGSTPSARSEGLYDKRSGVTFPEGFQIERTYLGRQYRASVTGGQWVIDGLAGRFSKLNELSRAIGTTTENAWISWFFIGRGGERLPVSDLRDPSRISSRSSWVRNDEVAAVNDVSTDQKVRWCDDVRSALGELGGEAPLSQIYEKVTQIRRKAGRSTPPSLQEVVRKELEMRSSDSEVFDADRGEDWFKMAAGKGGGVWALRAR